MPIRKSRVSGITASGTTADRPSNPSIGDQFYNGTLGVLELYTSSGWLPATGANDFNIVLTGEDTSVILDKEYFAGAYTITSALEDTSFDLYLFDTQGAGVGYAKTPSVNATNNFNRVVVLGGTAGDLLSFSYKTTFTTSSETSALGAGPIIKSISVTDLPSIDDTTVIAGINFAESVEVTFTGTNDVALSAKSVVRSSATSLIVTRPDNLLEDYSPYTVTVTNPGVTAPTGTNGHIATNAITAGGDPSWTTSAGNLDDAVAGQAYSFTVSAPDPDGGPISYSLVSGQLPTGLSLNSETGEISGTPTGTSETFIIAATDNGNNVTNRSFGISVGLASGGVISIDSGYVYHTFTGSGTFEAFANITAEILVVAGGGAGGVGNSSSSVPGAGGGAGGYRALSQQSISAGSYSVTVGAGGTSLNTSAQITGPSGTSSQFGAIATATGGGGGASRTTSGGSVAGNGGSGGGANINQGGGGVGGTGNAGGYTPPEGYGGGSGAGDPGWCGGGGGASAAGTSWNAGGNGGAGSQWLDGNYYAGGGGRGKPNDPSAPIGIGGIGGGGSGVNGTQAENGEQSTGGGGGGGRADAEGGGASGAGGSGIVIVRYQV